MIKFNFDKKGIIILSNYRAGGTQFQQFVEILAGHHGLEPMTCGEIDTSFFNQPLKYTEDQIYGVYDDKFKIYLLNNPIAISTLNSNGRFKDLQQDYEFIYLYRKNTVNSLLSLGLWEEFIRVGLFADRELWTVDNMTNFHNNLIKNPIPHTDVTLGFSTQVFNSKDKVKNFNFKCMVFANQIKLNSYIAKEFDMQEVSYEEYEYDPENFFTSRINYLSEEWKERIRKTYKYKIPYISENYLEYYDDFTKLYLKEWGLVNQ